MDVAAFSFNPQAKGSVCSGLKFLRFNVKGPNILPPSLQTKDLIISNSHGSTVVPYRFKRLTTEGWMGILPTEDTYKWEFNNSEQITNMSYDAETRFLETGDYYYVQHQFLQKPSGFSTVLEDQNASTTLPDPTTDDHGAYYWNDSTNTVTFMDTRRKIFFRVFRCQYNDCIPPTVPPAPTGRPDQTYRWSDKETWKMVPVGSGGHPTETEYDLPMEGDEIIVPVGMWLIVDTSTPSLGRVHVYGTIEFEDTMDHVFNTTIIFIKGGTVAAGFSKSNPFTRNLNIILRGSLDPNDPDNTDIPMPSGTPSVGWKAIGVFGQLKLHGQLTGKTWVKLGATAAAGATQITLAQAVDPSWKDKQVMITTTGREVTETELRTVTDISGTTLTLDVALAYEHLGVTHTLGQAAGDVTLAAEVGLLTRNIVLEGNTYPGFEKKLGGRVLVSKLTQDGLDYEGSAQLDAVEFRNMGQLGFDDSADPRFSLTFHSLSPTGENYVSRCSFNTNYITALGFFSAGNITVHNNVIYHTVGAGILDTSAGNSFTDNLVSVNLFPGTYNGAQKKQNLDWYGAFDLNTAQDVVLEGNVVAGSDQAGYRTYGEDCNTPTLWKNNEVHNTIFGVLLWKKLRGASDMCVRVNNMVAWRIEDTAFYMQHHGSLLLTDVTSMDSKVGVNQLSFNPNAISHVFYPNTATIKDSLLIGASPSHSCAFHQSVSAYFTFFGKDKFWEGAVKDGNTGIIFATFMSSSNGAPKHKFSEAMSYPTLGGSSYIQNVKFVNYGTRACGTDVALITNMDSDDAVHPIFVSSLAFVDTPEDNRVFLHRPNLRRVNPSDCVDMDCDGLKKVLLEDTDGSLLGSAKATLTSQAEHEWDGDRRRGVGDYRIPVALKQNLDGTEIPEAQLYPNKGIIRDNSCTNMTAWQGWKCSGLTHRMLVIESMDSDTEIRRLSPIALIGDPGPNGYVDLVNGPMDRGWCFGYTCQERISTFYTVVAAGKVYQMAMTSSPPQHIRLRLLNAAASETVLLRIFFPKTQRYDVYLGENYVNPTNIDNTKAGHQLYPEDPSYEPKLSDPSGTNYLQQSQKFLHVVVKGSEAVDIKVTPLIIFTTGVVVDPDDLFEANIVQNLADLLGVSPDNIRVTNIVREDSRRRRRKRAMEEVAISFEIGTPPSKTLTGNETAAEGLVLSRDDLPEKQAILVNFLQTGNVDNPSVNISITKLQIEEPITAPKKPGRKATKEKGEVVINGGELYSKVQQKKASVELRQNLEVINYDLPSDAIIEQAVTGTVFTYTAFDPYPSISVQDGNGNPLKNLGHPSDPWKFSATLIGGPQGASLMGYSQVPYQDGRVNFTDLFVDLPGKGYKIRFNVTHPIPMPLLTVDLGHPFRAKDKQVTQLLMMPQEILYTNMTFNLTISLVDRSTREPLDDSVLMGQTMTTTLALLSGSGAHLDGDTSWSMSGGNMTEVVVEGLSISIPSYAYRLQVTSAVRPVGWDITVDSDMFSVLPNKTDNLMSRVFVFKLRGKTKKLVQARAQFAENLLKKLEGEVSGDVFWGPVTYFRNRRMRKILTVKAKGTEEKLKDAMSKVCAMISSRQGLRVAYTPTGARTRSFSFSWMKDSQQMKPPKYCKWRKPKQ